MPKLYDTLGVPPDASPEDVKKAFRRRSSKAHPDKGGNHEDQAKVNRAYAVLADPVSRARYDATGDEGGPQSMQQRAHELIVAAFAEALDEDAPNILEAAAKKFVDGAANVRQGQANLDSDEKKVKRRRGKIKAGKGPNLMEGLLDSRQQIIDQKRAEMKDLLELLTTAKTLLAEYTTDEKTPTREEMAFAALSGAMTGRRSTMFRFAP